MRRIALGGALLATLVVQAGCGTYNTRQAAAKAAAAYPASAETPTLIQGGLDPDVQIAAGANAESQAPQRATVSDSTMLQGTLGDGYRDSPSPDF